MTFEKHFTNSIEFRARLDKQPELDQSICDLLEANFRNLNKLAMEEPYFGLRQSICSLAAKFSADKAVTPYNYQCLADCHVFLRACIDQGIIKDNYMTLTIGDVSYNDELLFNASRDTVQRALDYGISSHDKPQFHVWLTMGDMTVIDFTIKELLEGRGLVEQPVADDSRLTVWRSERPAGLNYQPVLVDDDFLERLKIQVQ